MTENKAAEAAVLRLEVERLTERLAGAENELDQADMGIALLKDERDEWEAKAHLATALLQEEVAKHPVTPPRDRDYERQCQVESMTGPDFDANEERAA